MALQLFSSPYMCIKCWQGERSSVTALILSRKFSCGKLLQTQASLHCSKRSEALFTVFRGIFRICDVFRNFHTFFQKFLAEPLAMFCGTRIGQHCSKRTVDGVWEMETPDTTQRGPPHCGSLSLPLPLHTYTDQLSKRCGIKRNPPQWKRTIL